MMKSVLPLAQVASPKSLRVASAPGGRTLIRVSVSGEASVSHQNL